MIYQLSLEHFPIIDKIYSVTRHTVWQTMEPTHILIFVTSGRCYIESDGKTTLLEEGGYILIPQNIHYVRRPVENTPCTMFYVHFDVPLQSVSLSEAQKCIRKNEKIYNEYFFDSDSLSPNQNLIYLSKSASLPDKTKELESMLEKATSDFGTYNILTPLLAASEICHFLVLLSAQTIKYILNENETSQIKTELPIKLQMAIMYIKQHDTDRVSLEDLCVHCNVSKQYLIRCFKNHLQTTPTAYIIQYKISKACNLLQNNNANIQEISNELGFENQCYFSRVFTKKMGESPTKFRTRVLNLKEKTTANDTSKK